MLDVSVSYNKYKFLGYEFLTWLWFSMENGTDLIKELNQTAESLTTGNRIVFENRRMDSLETLTIKGDDAGMEEGLLALSKGAYVAELNLNYKQAELSYVFTIKAESLAITGLKIPETESAQDDIDGAVLERIYLYNKVISLVDKVYKHFIDIRVSQNWQNSAIPLIKKWINSQNG